MRVVDTSLTNLGLQSLHGLLLHRPLELLNKTGDKVFATMLALKEQGLVKNIGASVYGPEDLGELVPRFKFDIVQAPMNILDQRIIQGGWAKRLRESGTELHIRSAFLQGLLLMEAEYRPSYFLPWSNMFTAFEDWLAENKLSRLEACLGFLNESEYVDKIVVGVDKMSHLREIVSALGVSVPALPAYLQSQDLALINPASWKI